MVYRETTFCLIHFHDIAHPPKVKTQPIVDFVSPKIKIQFVIIYPSIISRNFT